MADSAPSDWSAADPDPFWTLSTERREPWLRAYLGNGMLGIQVGTEGGLAGSQGQPLRLAAGLYDRAPGREVEHPVPLPGWRGLSLRVDGRPLAPEHADQYRQDSRLYHGLIETTHTWALPEGHITAVTVQAVLRQTEHLGLTRLTVTASMTCSVTVSVESDPPRELAPLEIGTGVTAGYPWMTAQTYERAIILATAGLLVDEDAAAPAALIGGSATCRLAPDQPRRFTWITAVRDSRSHVDPLEAALADAARAAAIGAPLLLAGHAAAWHELWQADIQIEGDPATQRFVRAGLYALLCSLREGVPASVAPMGLSSMGYNGHIFWDAETWMFPPILLVHPNLAREMLAYRQDRLRAARVRARAEGYSGAMFPWESATDGDDVTPLSIARTGLKEHHITACVAISHWHYYLASGDHEWLGERGWPVLEAAAEFWCSRAIRTARGYEIHDVIAADEYAEDVNNNAFTNGAARAALLAALAAAAVLNRPVRAAWQDVADHLVMPMADDLVLEFDGYDGRVVKQADVELLTFPLEYPLSREVIARNLDTYRRVTDPDGPAMGRCISAIVAAQLGRRDEARRLFAACYRPHLWGPFQALAETRTNAEVHFLTGVGGALQSLLFGFAGLRLHDPCPALDPLLPADWDALRFTRLSWRGAAFSLAILPGDRAEYVPLDAAIACVVALHRWRPGPDPLVVELRTEPDAVCRLDAPGWQAETAHGEKYAWRLRPRLAEPLPSFVRLHLTMQAASGRRQEILLEQRVRDGDDGPPTG
ncbi:MAG: glycosyl hydrolase family 65 protein [Chloroflexota bacterium]